MPTVADYITNTLYSASSSPAFLLAGGYAMHLHDSIRRHPRQDWVCCLHEQAVAMAVDGFAKVTGTVGLGYLTAGPGAINALNGVAGAWLDSSPCVFVVGQLKRNLLIQGSMRQFGFQGFDTLGLARRMTKYAVLLTDQEQVKRELQKALAIAMEPRRGPVWLEVPVDLQGETYNPDDYPDCEMTPAVENLRPPTFSRSDVAQIASWIRASSRPLLLVGAGVRASGAAELLTDLLARRRLPVLTSRNGTDLIDADDPNHVGCPGVYGSRAANFAFEACDLFLSIGSRLEILVVGYDFESRAPNAKRIVVDCDVGELEKPSINPHLKVQADARAFLVALDAELGDYVCSETSWRERIDDWKSRYPVCDPSYADSQHGINSYHLLDALGREAERDAVFVVDACHAIYTFPQSFRTKLGQRHILTGGLATMGYFPAAIGAARAASGRSVYAIIGDGSLQMNVQELKTIQHNRLPIKIIVLNNNGYLLIKLTQSAMMDGRFIGSTPETGVAFPDLEKLAAAFDFPYMRIERAADVKSGIDQLTKTPGPILLDVRCDDNQLIIPRLRGEPRGNGVIDAPRFDDLFPHLPEDEYHSNRKYPEDKA